MRLAGVGGARREPFQPVPGRADHVALDPAFGAMFFRGFRPGVAFDPLAADKPATGLRVVALGGSTTAGFPYSFPYGFPARLADRLEAALPGQPVEVANLGMTATNSFTVWALADAVARQRPDAVVIYSGQNEFYGAYGTAGTQGLTGTSVPLKRFVIGASRTALVTGLTGLFSGSAEPVGETRTMMAQVIGNAAVAPESDAFRAAVAQYEANLRSAIGRFERAHIPVYLATLTSNLAGQAPLGDEPAAQATFDRGQALLAHGDTAAARTAFLEAKEADGLRFRAPEAINDAIRRLAAEFPNVTLVDVQQRFRDASPGGLEAPDLFTDHLHPTARGYALMADAFSDAMRRTLPALRASLDPGPSPFGLDSLEAGAARLQILALTSGPPFRKDRTPEQAAATARAAAAQMVASGRPAAVLAARTTVDGMPMAVALDAAVRAARAAADTTQVLGLYAALLHWQPFNDDLMAAAVGYAAQNPAYDTQTMPLARFASVHGGRLFGLNTLAALSLRGGDVGRADALLTAAEALDARSPEMLFNRARYLVMRQDTAAARTYFERYQAVSVR